MPGKQKREDTLACGTSCLPPWIKNLSADQNHRPIYQRVTSIALKTDRSPELFSEWSRSMLIIQSESWAFLSEIANSSMRNSDFSYNECVPRKIHARGFH